MDRRKPQKRPSKKSFTQGDVFVSHRRSAKVTTNVADTDGIELPNKMRKECETKLELKGSSNNETVCDKNLQASDNSYNSERVRSYLFRLSGTKSFSKSTEAGDVFSKLSDEVILIIFKKLEKKTLVDCACVCQRWRRIAYDSRLWRRIDLTSRVMPPDSLGHVFFRDPHVLRMTLTEVVSPLLMEMSFTMEHFTCKLEYLDLSMASIKTSDLKRLLEMCSSLKKLSLENCEVDDAVCKEIAKNVELSVLNLSQCRGLNCEGIQMILRGCEQILELNVAWTLLNNISIRSVCELVSGNILKINLSGGLKEMSDIDVALLVTRCTKLQDLDLSDCTALTEASVESIRRLEYLKNLSLSRCYMIKPSKYLILFMMTSLKYLNIFGLMENRQIETLQKHTTKVQLNKIKFSYIARPTVGIRRSSIWSIQVKE